MDSIDRLTPAPLSGCDAKRICLIKPSSLGDVVQALPVFHGLRRRFPGARISWVVNSAYAPLIEPLPGLSEVIAFDRQSFRASSPRSWMRFRRFLKSLSRRQFDLAVDLQCLLRSGLMTWATRADVRVGLRSAREASHLFFTHVADDRAQAAAVERYWRVMDLLGAGGLSKSFSLELGETEIEWSRRQLEDLPGPRLAINPGARWETKRWPPERFAEAANAAIAKHPRGSVVILGGPGEELTAQACQDRLTVPSVNFCGKTGLRQLAALLAQCDLLFTNDTGPMHLAGAVGTPTLSLFTCTAPERAAPHGQGHRVVQTSVPCRASYLRQCDRMDCMRDLDSTRVLPELETSLQLVTIDAATPPTSNGSTDRLDRAA